MIKPLKYRRNGHSVEMLFEYNGEKMTYIFGGNLSAAGCTITDEDMGMVYNSYNTSLGREDGEEIEKQAYAEIEKMEKLNVEGFLKEKGLNKNTLVYDSNKRNGVYLRDLLMDFKLKEQ